MPLIPFKESSKFEGVVLDFYGHQILDEIDKYVVS